MLSTMKSAASYRYRLLTLVYAVIILILTSTPGDRVPKFTIAHFDKIVHFSIYYIFGVLLLLAVFEFKPLGSLKSILTALITGLGFGALDEFHQFWIPNRFPDVLDFLADAAGLSLGILSVFLFILLKYIKVRL